MFGMGDIAMGTAMEMNGAMDMADGMMLTEMGMPGLGAMEMGIGAMEMGMGQNMVNMGMMENMYGGYGMGMGYGMGGMMAMDTALMMGCMGMGCTLACCNPGLYRRGCMGMGCNLPCCLPRRRFGNCMGFGCTGPCCTTTTTEVIIVNGNNNRAQYQYPQQQYQNQGQYQYQNGYRNQQQYQNSPQQYQNPPQYQQYQNLPPQQYQQYQGQYQNGNYKANQPQTKSSQEQSYQQQQQNFQQTIAKPQPSDQLYQQQQQFKQSTKTINPQTINYPQVQQQKQVPSNQFNINNSFASQNLRQYQNQLAFQSSQLQFQSYPQNQQYFNRDIIFKGHLLKRHGFNWTEHPSAVLTRQHLLDQPLNQITKLKIKTDPIHQNACFMKITINYSEDHFYGCYKNQQLDWFCSIVWAKMALMGKIADQSLPFTGYIEGNILRKSQFLGNWEFRHVKIDPNGLRSFQNVNSMATLHLSSIKQLWTRFQYLNGGHYLVIKCKSNGTKYEYGIPVNYAFSWIKAFYSLLV